MIKFKYMKFVLKGPLKENIHNLARRIGYRFWRSGENEKSELNFIRSLGGDSGFPRFHLYLKIEGENLVFNLHLDQKKPVYKAVSAHSGEYNGELVGKEAERVKEILSFPPSLP